MRWRSNQLSHPDDLLGQAIILLLLDPHYPPGQHYCHLSLMVEKTYVGITLSRGFYVNGTYKQVLMKILLAKQPSGRLYINNLRGKFPPGPGFEPGSPALHAGALTN